MNEEKLWKNNSCVVLRIKYYDKRDLISRFIRGRTDCLVSIDIKGC